MEEDSGRKQFDTIDAVVFTGMLCLYVIVGIHQAYKARNSEDPVKEYLVGGQQMSVFPISMSLIVSYTSGVPLLGFPAEIYVYGTQFCCIAMSDTLVSLTIATVYLPVFYGLQITSAYEYLEMRFNPVTRLIGSTIFTLKMLLSIPLMIYIPALAFNQVTGVNLHKIAMVVSAVCIFYTCVGGLKAVVWTDVIQAMLMFFGVIAVAVLGTKRAGGVAEVWKRNDDTGRIEFFNMNPDLTLRTSFWSVVVGNYLEYLASCSVDQAMVQRCLAMPNLKKSNQTIMIMALGNLLIILLSGYTGLVLFAAYYNCDPITTKQIQKSDQLLPFFVMELSETIPGFPGIFVSCIFGASLSSMSTRLNSLSGVIYEDMIKPCLRKPMSDAGASRVMKITVVITGTICTALVFFVDKLGGIIQSGSSFSGITAGPLLAMFTLGMFCPFVNSAGAIVGAFVSLVLVAWISFGTQVALATGEIHSPTMPVSIDGCPESLRSSVANISLFLEESIKEETFFLYRMSYLWYTWVGFITAVIVGLLASWITGFNTYKPDDIKLYTSIIHKFLKKHPRNGNQVSVEFHKKDQNISSPT